MGFFSPPTGLPPPTLIWRFMHRILLYLAMLCFVDITLKLTFFILTAKREAMDLRRWEGSGKRGGREGCGPVILYERRIKQKRKKEEKEMRCLFYMVLKHMQIRKQHCTRCPHKALSFL